MKNLLSIVGLVAAGFVAMMMTPQDAEAVASYSKPSVSVPLYLNSASSAGLSLASTVDFDVLEEIDSSTVIPDATIGGAAAEGRPCSTTGTTTVCSSALFWCTAVSGPCSSNVAGGDCSASLQAGCSANAGQECSASAGFCSVHSGGGGSCTTSGGGGSCSVQGDGNGGGQCSVMNDDGTVTGGSQCSG